MPRRNLSIKEKENLVNKFHDGLSPIELKQEFKVSLPTIFRLRQNESSIKEANANGLSRRTRLEKNENIILHDRLVKEFILRCSEIGLPVTAKLIKCKAREIAAGIGRENLHCSPQWFARFKERINLKFGNLSGEKKSVDMRIVDRWKDIEIPRLMLNWQDEFIFNCDETGLFWRQLPVKTYFISKTEHIGDKIFKERISILFCVNKLGTKLNPLIIGKSENPRCFYSGCLKNLNVDYVSQTNAWMNKQIFSAWLHHWHDELVTENKKVVLILDNFIGHCVDTTPFPLITFQFLPPKTTCLTQPLDGGIIHSFKAKYLSFFTHYLVNNLNENPLSQIVKKIDLLRAISWVDEAWKSVTSETIVNCWNHFGYVRSEIPVNSTSQCDPQSDLDDLNHLLNELRVSVNCCSSEELLNQVTFEYQNFFE